MSGELTVERVREMLEGATPGEWLTDQNGYNGFVYALNEAGCNRMSAGVQAGKLSDGTRVSSQEAHATAALIAAAPTLARLALSALAERDAAVARAEEWRELLESAEHWLAYPPTSNSDRHLVSDLGRRIRAALASPAASLGLERGA